MATRDFKNIPGASKPGQATDLGRRNTITALLEEWGLLKIVDDDIDEPRVGLNQLKILSYKDKDEWELIPKYHIGRR